jgi:MSHA biogenesis protein MshK
MNRATSLRAVALCLLSLCWLASTPAEDLQDPTRPPLAPNATTGAATVTTSAAVARPARLEAVLHSAGRAVAIIDGKLLRVGDGLGDARIAAITSDAVQLTRAGRTITLRLANQAMKVRREASSKDQE